MTSKPDTAHAITPVETAKPPKAPDTLAGASFLQQEPDLAKEAGLNVRAMSGWAAGSASISD